MSRDPREITGWLLDLYADPNGELALWVVQDTPGCEDRVGRPILAPHDCACASPFRSRSTPPGQTHACASYGSTWPTQPKPSR